MVFDRRWYWWEQSHFISKTYTKCGLHEFHCAKLNDPKWAVEVIYQLGSAFDFHRFTWNRWLSQNARIRAVHLGKHLYAYFLWQLFLWVNVKRCKFQTIKDPNHTVTTEKHVKRKHNNNKMEISVKTIYSDVCKQKPFYEN